MDQAPEYLAIEALLPLAEAWVNMSPPHAKDTEARQAVEFARELLEGWASNLCENATNSIAWSDVKRSGWRVSEAG